MKPLNVAVAKGRLLEPTLALFRDAGFDVPDLTTTRRLARPVGGRSAGVPARQAGRRAGVCRIGRRGPRGRRHRRAA